jgi:hypothetical protein
MRHQVDDRTKLSSARVNSASAGAAAGPRHPRAAAPRATPTPPRGVLGRRDGRGVQNLLLDSAGLSEAISHPDALSGCIRRERRRVGRVLGLTDQFAVCPALGAAEQAFRSLWRIGLQKSRNRQPLIGRIVASGAATGGSRRGVRLNATARRRPHRGPRSIPPATPNHRAAHCVQSTYLVSAAPTPEGGVWPRCRLRQRSTCTRRARGRSQGAVPRDRAEWRWPHLQLAGGGQPTWPTCH